MAIANTPELTTKPASSWAKIRAWAGVPAGPAEDRGEIGGGVAGLRVRLEEGAGLGAKGGVGG
jgi:hypothetical protein